MTNDLIGFTSVGYTIELDGPVLISIDMFEEEDADPRDILFDLPLLSLLKDLADTLQHFRRRNKSILVFKYVEQRRGVRASYNRVYVFMAI